MITKPFNFESHLRRPVARFESMPFINVCLIALFFTVFKSPYVMAPGSTVELPKTRGAPIDAVATSRVLTVGENDGREMLIFDGRFHKIDTLGEALKVRVAESPGETLLIRADRDVSMQLLVRICEMAEQSGYARIHLAAEPERAVAAPFQ
jgi:biopolymer transport protein ExbD